MADSKIPALPASRNLSCPSCGKPMYPHRSRFLCSDSLTCGRVYVPGRLNLAAHLWGAEGLPQALESYLLEAGQ